LDTITDIIVHKWCVLCHVGALPAPGWVPLLRSIPTNRVPPLWHEDCAPGFVAGPVESPEQSS
jgi:hypothetical protein